MGCHNASKECNERVTEILQGCEGAVHIKDDVVVHGKGEEHDRNLDAVLKRMEEKGLTLRREKCEFGKSEIKWFGMIFSKDGMSPDPEKVKIIKEWPRPEDKSAVKSFLQTVQFSQVFLKPKNGLTYFDITAFYALSKVLWLISRIL